jgi:hypothetical protein
MSRRLHYGTLLVQFLLASAIFRLMANYRLMDPDEGHFLSAIRSVYHGLVPSQDFFYQQMPLFPYPYAASMGLFGYGYEPCLWVSVACGAGLATVAAAWYIRSSGGILSGWAGWLLVVLNAQVLFWTPTVKNHAMPLFLGAFALYASFHPGGKGSTDRWWGALSGFSAVWAVGTRVLALPFFLLAVTWLLLRAASPSTRQSGVRALQGFILGTLPPLLLMLRSMFPDPWVFYFNNLGYHGMRSGSLGTFGSLNSVMAELLEMLLQGQFPVVLAAALLVVICGRCFHSRAPAAGPPPSWFERLLARESIPSWMLASGVGAAVLALAPAQTFHQYFMVPLIFFLLAGVPLWHTLLYERKNAGKVVAGLMLIGYAATPCTAGLSMFNHREWIFPQLPKEFSLPEVRALSRKLAEVTEPGDSVLSTWQGFTFLADRREYPGNENFNARIIAGRLTDEQLSRLRMASNAELAAAVDRGEPKAIVFGFFAGQYREALGEVDPISGDRKLRSKLYTNYRMIMERGAHSIWLRKEPGRE